MTGVCCIKCTRLSHSHISRKLGLYSLPPPQQSNFGLRTFPPMIAFLLANLHNVYNSHRYNKPCTLHKKMKFSIKDFFSKFDQIRSFFWSVFSCIRTVYGDPYSVKYGPEKTPYLNIFHAVTN